MCLPTLKNKIHYHSTTIEQNDPRVFNAIPMDTFYLDSPPVFKHPVSRLLARDFGPKVAQDHEDCNVDPYLQAFSNGCCTIIQNHSRCRDTACRECQRVKAENLISECNKKASISRYPWFSAVSVTAPIDFTASRRALRHILKPYFAEYKIDWHPDGVSIRAFIFGGLTKLSQRQLIARFGQSTTIRTLPHGEVEPLLRDVFAPALPADNEELMRWRRAISGRKMLGFWRPSRGDLLRIGTTPENLIRNKPQRVWKRSLAPKVCMHGKPILSSTPMQRLSTMLGMPELFFIKTNAPRQWRN